MLIWIDPLIGCKMICLKIVLKITLNTIKKSTINTDVQYRRQFFNDTNQLCRYYRNINFLFDSSNYQPY